ncbi:MAG: hypothetical protein KGH75_00965 [Rhodospirillales bacterium]|nr:hypothetical protein [Rhodospirillales bacterium]
MTASGIGYGLLQTGISLGSVFNSLASGSDAITAAITLPAVTNSTGASPYIADLELIMGASITTGTGAPYIQGTWIFADSSSNYDGFYGVVAFQLYPINYTSFTAPFPASTALGTVLRVPGIILPRVLSTSAANAKLVLFNNLGAAFNASVTATLYPAGDDIG